MTERLFIAATVICFALPVMCDGEGAAARPPDGSAGSQASASRPSTATTPAPRAVLDKYCVTCHNQKLKTGGLALDAVDAANVGADASTWEKVLLKLSTRAMPPAGRPRPDDAGRAALLSWLEGELDRNAAAHPNLGHQTLRRLNRTEYANAIRDLLGLSVDGASLLPLDNAAYGFDNNADSLTLSPAATERYLSAAATISHLALARVVGTPAPQTYMVPTSLDQRSRVSEELPFGSRGGVAIHHYFPVDGDYFVKMRIQEKGYGLMNSTDEPSQIDARLDGVKVWSYVGGGSNGRPGQYKDRVRQQEAPAEPATPSDKPSTKQVEEPVAEPTQPQVDDLDAKRPRRIVEGADEERDTQGFDDGLEFHVRAVAGPHVLQVFFVDRTSAYLEDLIEPELRSKYLQGNTAGDPGISKVTITGPYDAVGAPDSPSRRHTLICRPTPRTEAVCAKRIIANLVRRAYRRPITESDLQEPLELYRTAARKGGFDLGIEVALRGILVSPEFLFRFENQPADVAANTLYRVSDVELASRLSFFLWSSIPDDELLDVAVKGNLHTPAVLEQQVRRMLADDRSAALINNFAAQWLQLRNMNSVSPNPEWRFDDNLRQEFRRETELLVNAVVHEDRSVLDFLDADYTFVNENLAKHYGIPGVYGPRFRRISLPADSVRRGLLGQAAILTVTSLEARTSAVLRGKWILENILGTPPPPPPPNVPSLEDHNDDGKILSAREQMVQHRKNSVCASCHSQMDPLGFALENFDAVGRWRTTDASGALIDPSGALPGGGTFRNPVELRAELMKRSGEFVRTLTEKLMIHALGRGLEYYDAPTVRRIRREAASTNFRFSSIIMGVVKSAAFQKRVAVKRETHTRVATSAQR
ncbi:MAG: hypothetical protein DMF92_07455 [Acidobacteria bacterium]|nr:MAG: hypothetical protein DMF92_07455 [Acidobacteriota bacterium]